MQSLITHQFFIVFFFVQSMSVIVLIIGSSCAFHQFVKNSSAKSLIDSLAVYIYSIAASYAAALDGVRKKTPNKVVIDCISCISWIFVQNFKYGEYSLSVV